MHFAIDAGHNSPPGDTGAVGLAVEDKLTRELAAKVIALLKTAGHEVTDCRYPQSATLGESLAGRVEIANRSGADIYVSLHFNKFLDGVQTTNNPMGAEIFVASPSGRKIAGKVLPQITRLGWKNRGVKDSGLYVLVHTNMPAILIESCFLESIPDMELFKKVGMDRLASAIVGGLLAA